MVKIRRYTLVIFLVTALFCGLFASSFADTVKGGLETTTATVLVTARPDYTMPPGGGGDEDPTPTSPEPPPELPEPPGTVIDAPFVTICYVYSEVVNSSGVFATGVMSKSRDQNCGLLIPINTIGLTQDGMPLCEVCITRLAQSPFAPPTCCNLLSSVYDITPEGTTFNPPVVITLTYNPSALPEGYNEENLGIATWYGEKWVALHPSTVDLVNHTVSAPVSHFTHFALVSCPTSLSLHDLTINPETVRPGETVDIGVTAANTGFLTASVEVTLQIDGQVVASRNITLSGGDSETVSFETVPDEAGVYPVAIGSLNGSFRVKNAPPWLMIGIIIAVLAALLLYFIFFRRQPPKTLLVVAGDTGFRNMGIVPGSGVKRG